MIELADASASLTLSNIVIDGAASQLRMQHTLRATELDHQGGERRHDRAEQRVLFYKTIRRLSLVPVFWRITAST